MRSRNILLNFADCKYSNSQKRNTASGIVHGFDTAHQCTPRDIGANFANKYQSILNQPRGCGYWLWKPYFISRYLNQMNGDDVLFYSDSGSDFIKNITSLLNLCRDDRNGLIAFELSGKHKERQYTKRDLFIEMNQDTPEYTDTDQLMASFIMIQKNEFTIQFMNEYLKYACNEHLITDTASRSTNYPEFKDHRHDQSIFSLLCKKHQITHLDDPTQWGQKHKQYPPGSQYIWHRRNNNHIKLEPRVLEGVRIGVIPG